MLDSLTNFIDIMFVIIVGIFIVATVIIFVVRKKNLRLGIKKEGESSSTNCRVVDASTFLPFEDIVETSKGAVVIKKENKKYLKILATSGNDYFNLGHDGRVSIIGSEIARTNTIDKSTQTWQYSRPVSMNSFIEKYEKKRDYLIRQVLDREVELKELQTQSEYVADEDFDVFYENFNRKKVEMLSLDYQRKVIDERIQYMRNRESDNSNPEICICDVVEWDYNPLDFTENLSDENIWKQAVTELNSKTASQIDLLRNSSVFARRMRKNEIIEALREQVLPINAKRYDIDKILKSNIYEFVTDSSSLEEEQRLAMEAEKENEQIKNILNGMNSEAFKRKEELLSDKIRVPFVCKNCGRRVNINMTHEQYFRYYDYLQGHEAIQNILYDLSDDQRELILTGLCNKCDLAEIRKDLDS